MRQRIKTEYTIAQLMNSPTVTPTMTASIAPPMSVPFAEPVKPLACKRPDYGIVGDHIRVVSE
jgi:hypothetical protein